tara:strand:- start:466 stop:1839 length:1374 start_codon:yes stop_codon:yes gene_type:complete
MTDEDRKEIFVTSCCRIEHTDLPDKLLYILQSKTVLYIPIVEPTKIDVGFSYLTLITLSVGDHPLLRENMMKPDYKIDRDGTVIDWGEPRDPEKVKEGIATYRDSMLPKFVHEDLASGKCKKLILNYSLEGYDDIDWDYISTIFGVEKSKIVWLTGIFNPEPMNSQSEVTVLFNPFWQEFVHDNAFYGKYSSEVSAGYKQQIKDIKDLKIRPYHGLNYNRIPRKHRKYLLAKLKTHKLLDQTSFSWGGVGIIGAGYKDWIPTSELTDENLEIVIEEKFEVATKENILSGETDYSSFKYIIKMDEVNFPDEDLTTNKAHSINFNHIKDAYFQIISETLALHTDPNHRPFLSEKSYKPFASGMPFVMWGHANTVMALKEQRYKTFDDWINHDYDRMTDSAERFHALVQEIKRLYAIPPEEWSIMLKEMLPDIEHNLKQIQLNCHKSGFQINPRVLRLIL